MNDYSEELNAWAEDLAQVHLPRWEELPQLSLYMDQVLLYTNNALSFLDVTQSKNKKDERLLTPAMINNYVKHHLVPKPVKKRYDRAHLACILSYVLLKPVLQLGDIQKLLVHLQALCGDDEEAAYNLLCAEVEASLLHASALVHGEGIAQGVDAEAPATHRAVSMAAMSLATKVVAQKILLLQEAVDDETTHD